VPRRSLLRALPPALRHRNFRLFLGGQFLSQCGTWIQSVARAWLVLQLTDSAFTVGLVTALGSLPILLFTLYGGVVADRVNKRLTVLILQALMLTEALALAILTGAGIITVHWIMGLAVFYGLLSAFEVPTRQALISEIVGKADLMNAIALNSSAFNVARVVGPSIAGALIATVGLAACFYVNAASYLFVVAGLALMRVMPVERPAPSSALAALKEGFGYIFGNAGPRALVILIAVFGVFGFSFVTMMPVFARDVLQLDAGGYGALVSAVGVGAAAAALGTAAFGRRRGGAGVGRTWLLFGVLLAVGALAPNFWTALVVFTLTGCTMALNSILANTQLQLQAPDELRGRVMGFYSFVVLGMAPFGSLQAGWVAEHLGVRVAFGMGGVVCLLAALVLGPGGARADRRTGAQADRCTEARALEVEPTRGDSLSSTAEYPMSVGQPRVSDHVAPSIPAGPADLDPERNAGDKPAPPATHEPR
jgi:MFS family permease